jgi:hypothetical protein
MDNEALGAVLREKLNEVCNDKPGLSKYCPSLQSINAIRDGIFYLGPPKTEVFWLSQGVITVPGAHPRRTRS